MQAGVRTLGLPFGTRGILIYRYIILSLPNRYMKSPTKNPKRVPIIELKNLKSIN